MAFLSREVERGWWVVWHDATKGVGRLGRRKAKVIGGKHDDAFDAAGVPVAERPALRNATTPKLRRKLRDCYSDLEAQRYRKAETATVTGALPAHDTPIGALLDTFERVTNRRAALGRGEHPDPLPDAGLRATVTERTLSPRGAKESLRVLRTLREELPADLTTGRLAGDVLGGVLTKLRAERKWSPSTANRWRVTVSAFFNMFTAREARRLFRETPATWFADDVAPLPTPRQAILIHSAAEVTRFLEAAERWADPALPFTVTRRRNGKVERFEQTRGKEPANVLAWALVFATLGIRRSEAARLRWADCDLEAGNVIVFSTKTQRARTVRLTGDPDGDVSPGMVAVLRAWRNARPDSTFVLPGEGDRDGVPTPPTFPHHSWARVAEQAGTPNLTPQTLRRTWESGLAALGFPAAIAAFMAGHSAQVAERHYREFAVGRLPGATLDDALGLAPFLQREATEGAKLRLLRREVEAG